MARIRIHQTNSNLSPLLSNENIEIELALISSDEASSLVSNTVSRYFTVSRKCTHSACHPLGQLQSQQHPCPLLQQHQALHPQFQAE